MDIRPLTEDYAVSPQIAPEDVAAIKTAGFTTVICNRPDAENPAELQADAMRAVVEAVGLTFIVNPVVHGQLTQEIVDSQGQVIAESTGPVLAYCASGNRSSVVWALSQAGSRPVDELIGIPARYGYHLEGLRSHLESLSEGRPGPRPALAGRV